MGKKITCTNVTGVSVYFDYTYTPFFLVSCDGLYTVSNNVKRSDNTNTDGSTYQGSNTKERNIVIAAQMCENYQSNRDILYKCFRPKTRGTLVFEEEAERREIEYKVESIEVGEKGVIRDITISLLCCDPFFTDTEYTVELMASWQAGFEFMHEFKSTKEEIGHRVMELIKDIDNAGTTDTVGMVITLEALGSVSTPIIRNITTGEHITLNYDFKTGDVVQICTETNKKNVYLIRAGEKKSINGYIDEDSEFIQLQAGTNTLQYEAKSGKKNLDVTVEYKQKYLGV